MRKLIKEKTKISTSGRKSPNAGVLYPSVMSAGIRGGNLYKPVRKGNYSGIGYTSIDGPLTEAEQWNMPFIDPEFGYESHSEE
jgi:hypothetical protein